MTYMYKEPAIEVEGLRKVYRSLVAVDDVSFVMSRGEAFGFLGPNGAGKSTVVKILTGLVAPTKGTIRILGQPVNNLEMRRRIGYLPELPTFHKWLRARDFLMFHGHPWVGKAARSSRLQQGTGSRSHPRRVTMKVTPTDHLASGLSSWLWLMRMRADKSAPTDFPVHLLIYIMRSSQTQPHAFSRR